MPPTEVKKQQHPELGGPELDINKGHFGVRLQRHRRQRDSGA